MIKMLKWFALMFAALVYAALGFAANVFAQVEQPNLRFSLEWLFRGTQAPITYAVQKGIFKAQGLTVTVDRGAGAGDTVNRVASGAYDAGFSDLNAIIKFNAENPGKEVQAFYVVFDSAPHAIFAFKDSSIRTPKDLEGKKVGAPAFDGARQLFPAFAKANDVDASKVRWETMAPQLREPMLIRREVDAISGYITSAPFALRTLGAKLDDVLMLRFNDAGVDFFGSVIFARADWLAKNPQTAAALTRAVNQAMIASINDPRAAVASLKERDALVDLDLEQSRLLLTLRDLVLTPNARTSGLGGADPARLQRTIDFVLDAYGVKTKLTPAQVFADRFLPARAERIAPEKSIR